MQNLSAKIKRFMFTHDKIPVVLTQNIASFIAVMAAFSEYEETVVSEVPNFFKELINLCI